MASPLLHRMAKGDVMNKLYILALVLVLGVQSFAATSHTEVKPQTYVFKFSYKGEKLEVRRQVATYDQAFEQAAQTCFNHFKRNHEGKLTEDQGLDIIDVCANPRSS